MKRATITIDDNLERALDGFLRTQEIQPTLTALVRVALAEYLARRNYALPTHPLLITPAPRVAGNLM